MTKKKVTTKSKEDLFKLIKEIASSRADLDRRAIDADLEDLTDLESEEEEDFFVDDPYQDDREDAEDWDMRLTEMTDSDDDEYSHYPDDIDALEQMFDLTDPEERETYLKVAGAKGLLDVGEQDMEDEYMDDFYVGKDTFESDVLDRGIDPLKLNEDAIKAKMKKDKQWDKALSEAQIIKQLVKNMVKEDYYNLMGINNATPTTSNRFDVDTNLVSNDVDSEEKDKDLVISKEEREYWDEHPGYYGDDEERWPKDDDEGYEDEPGSRADEDDWKYRNVDLDEGFGIESGDRYFDAFTTDPDDRWDSIFNKMSEYAKSGKINKFTPEEKEFIRFMSEDEKKELASLALGYLGDEEIIDDFVKEDRIDPLTGKGASGVQSQVAAKKKAMEAERAKEALKNEGYESFSDKWDDKDWREKQARRNLSDPSKRREAIQYLKKLKKEKSPISYRDTEAYNKGGSEPGIIHRDEETGVWSDPENKFK